jgi:acetyltransferase-like isoleucine patch superfamily enzyme
MPVDIKNYIIRVLKTNPGSIFEIIDSVITTVKFRYIKHCIGRNTIIRRRTEIINYANVRIGEESILQDFVYIRAGVNGKVDLGRGCMVNSFCRFFGHGGIEIGDFSQIGPGVTITTTDHDYTREDMAEIFKKVIIGKRVWIGANVTILPGVCIGDRTVIGAGSVVTKDLPSNSIAVGVPAKVIKKIEVDDFNDDKSVNYQ